MTGFILVLMSLLGGTDNHEAYFGVLIIQESGEMEPHSSSRSADGAHTGHLLFGEIVQIVDEGDSITKYPQVPLGWRKVTLEWDDDWWGLQIREPQ